MYYDGANWKWGDEMNLRFIERDGKKILQMAHDYHGYETWADVPCVEEKKEQRKLWETLSEKTIWTFLGKDLGSTPNFKTTAKAAIDAVIECYEEWDDLFIKHRKPFPEYLKEKLGNEGVK